jgi:hypothetical protein
LRSDVAAGPGSAMTDEADIIGHLTLATSVLPDNRITG